MERYQVDYAANTITITAAFAKKLQELNSAEFAFLAKLRATIPAIRVIYKTHRTPSRYHNRDGSTSSCNQFKNLTYKNMETFLSKLPEGEKFQEEYSFLKNYAGNLQRSNYTLVRRWLEAQFPLYRKNPLFYAYNTPSLVKGVTILQKEQDQDEVA